MKKGVSMTNARILARDGAADWLAVLGDAACTEVERHEFLLWLRTSTVNVEEFLELSTLMHRLQDPAMWPKFDVQALIDEALAGSVAPSVTRIGAPAETRKPKAVFVPRFAAAAAVILSVTALVMLGMGWFGSDRYHTAIGEQRLVTLNDGSVMQMNTKSNAVATFTSDERAIDLVDGEAIFRVKKDPSRPFVVRSGEARIVAVGTAFNVRTLQKKTVVTVLEGRVHVLDARTGAASDMGTAAGTFVESGQQLEIANGVSQSPIALADANLIIAWADRRIVFENTPIAAAVTEFSRYSVRHITVVDEELQRRQISGVFNSTDPESLIQFLSNDPRVQVRNDGNGWIVKLRAAE
jgi:transmembrane sensor